MSERVKRLDQALGQDTSNFKDFIQVCRIASLSVSCSSLHVFLTRRCTCLYNTQEEVALGKAVLFPSDSFLRDTTLCHFKSEHARLLGRVEERYQQADELLRQALHQHRYADVMNALATMEKMAEAGVNDVIVSKGATFNKRVLELLQHIHEYTNEHIGECKRMMEALRDPCRATPPTEAEVADFKALVQVLQEFKKQISVVLRGKVPNLNLVSSQMSVGPAELFPTTVAEVTTPRGTKSRRQKKKENTAAGDAWDDALYQMLRVAEIDLTRSLEEYACACKERCLTSLGEEPKPRAEDVVTFLKTLSICKELDPVFTAARPNSGSTQPFTEQRKVANAAVKSKFMEIRDTCSRYVRASQMAAAQSTLEIAKDMLVLRDEFAGDAMKMDDAVEEMRSDFDQKTGVFAQSVLKALNDERFGDLNTILLGYRDLTGAAQQEEYNAALSSLTGRGHEKYTLATQVIASINDDARGRMEFPPSMEQMAAALRWIEKAR